MKYYIIDNKVCFDSADRKYAEISESNQSFNYFKPTKKMNELFRCPQCGYTKSIKDNTGLEVVEFDSENIGDFTVGNTNVRYQFVCSEKMVKILEKVNGVKTIEKVVKVFVNGEEVFNHNLYSIELERINATISRRSSRLSNPIKVNRRICRVCNPDGNKYLTVEGIEIDNINSDIDIFIIYEDSSMIFISEKFRNILLSQGITNIIDRAILSSDYSYDLLDIKD